MVDLILGSGKSEKIITLDLSNLKIFFFLSIFCQKFLSSGFKVPKKYLIELRATQTGQTLDSAQPTLLST